MPMTVRLIHSVYKSGFLKCFGFNTTREYGTSFELLKNFSMFPYSISPLLKKSILTLVPNEPFSPRRSLCTEPLGYLKGR